MHVYRTRYLLCTPPGPLGCSRFLLQTPLKYPALYRQTRRHPHSPHALTSSLTAFHAGGAGALCLGTCPGPIPDQPGSAGQL